MVNYKRIESCRVCGATKLSEIMSFGMQTVIAFPDHANLELPKAPLELIMCANCSLVQLKYSFDRDLLYKDYWYESKINKSMVAALRNVVDSATKIINLVQGDVVMDIASNDNTLLKQYSQNGIIRIGVDPSNVAKNTNDPDIKVVNNYFSFDNVAGVLSSKAKIITCCAMFYDLDNPNEFLADIIKCLDKDGLFIIQMNYLGLMVKNKTYDDICHEHREFYSLKALEYLLARHKLEVIDSELNDVNGGSIRVYIKNKESNLSVDGGVSRVEELRSWEEKLKLTHLSTYQEFSRSIEANKQKMLDFIRAELSKGKTIYLEGCSTRGLTQMQYLGLTNKEITYGIEKNPRKFGKFYADTGVKIVSGSEIKRPPDYLYVLPYHFLASIKEEKREYLRKGGKLIVAIPEFKVIGQE